MRRIAVVGADIAGLGAAYELAKAGLNVYLYEKEDKLGGHTNNNVTIDGVQLDLAFMLFNRVSFPNLVDLFETLGVEMENSNISFSISLDEGLGCEWGTQNGLLSMFAQKRNIFNPYFWTMLRQLIKFRDDVYRYLDDFENNPELNRNETLGSFIKSRGYSKLCQKAYIIPICCSVWACGTEQVQEYPAFSILSRFRNNDMFQLTKDLLIRGCQIKTNCEVQSVVTIHKGCKLSLKDGSEEFFDGCILAIHAPNALKILGHQPTYEETTILRAFHYTYNDCFLHQDKTMMPQNRSTWSACNLLGSPDSNMYITYWLNVMQNIDKGDEPFFVTLSSVDVPKNILLKWSTRHPIPSFAASKASLAMDNIQGKRSIWFCDIHHGYGFHEEGLKVEFLTTFE